MSKLTLVVLQQILTLLLASPSVPREYNSFSYGDDFDRENEAMKDESTGSLILLSILSAVAFVGVGFICYRCFCSEPEPPEKTP